MIKMSRKKFLSSALTFFSLMLVPVPAEVLKFSILNPFLKKLGLLNETQTLINRDEKIGVQVNRITRVQSPATFDELNRAYKQRGLEWEELDEYVVQSVREGTMVGFRYFYDGFEMRSELYFKDLQQWRTWRNQVNRKFYQDATDVRDFLFVQEEVKVIG